MRNTLLLPILAFTAASAHAGVTLTLDPFIGSLRGLPGETVGWGFTLTSDPVNWISVVTTAPVAESDPGVGVYGDLAGLLGGPVLGVLAPGAPAWTLAFDAVNQLGMGTFTIDPGAAGGSVDSGLLDLNYEIFSADPNLCSTCAIGFADLQVPFQVEVVAPEPAPGWLMVPVFGLLWRRNKAARRTPPSGQR